MFDTRKFVDPSGDLFFDFVNTVVVRQGVNTDLLETPTDFFAWAASIGLLKKAEAKRLAASAKDSHVEFFAEVRRFRNALRGLAVDLTNGLPVSRQTVREINRHLRTVYGFEELKLEKGIPVLRFRTDFSERERILAPVAADAARLLTEGDPSLVKQCESDKCVLFFYDSTKNHSRRWCSMGSCGNREKAKAFYRRKKGEGSGKREW